MLAVNLFHCSCAFTSDTASSYWRLLFEASFQASSASMQPASQIKKNACPFFQIQARVNYLFFADHQAIQPEYDLLVVVFRRLHRTISYSWRGSQLGQTLKLTMSACSHTLPLLISFQPLQQLLRVYPGVVTKQNLALEAEL